MVLASLSRLTAFPLATHFKLLSCSSDKENPNIPLRHHRDIIFAEFSTVRQLAKDDECGLKSQANQEQVFSILYNIWQV